MKSRVSYVDYYELQKTESEYQISEVQNNINPLSKYQQGVYKIIWHNF